MAVMGGSGNLASDQVIINRLVRVFANTTIRASYSDASRAIGTVSTEGEYRASLLQNGYYYIDDLGGWVIRARASTIRDDTPNATQSADGEYQSSVSQSTVQQISQFTEEERKDIYMEYINNEYGDVMNVDDVGDNIMVDNLNGIYGIPYQFTETVDPRPDNSSFGSIYASRIITRMPLLMLSPGKVDFMNRSTSGEKLAIFDALIGSENNSDTKLGDFIKKPGKYYTFEYDEASDFQGGLARVSKNNKWGYVNALGEVVVPCEYDSVSDFHEGFGQVERNNKCGFVNKYGEVIVPCEYHICRAFNEGLSTVLKNNKWGAIDETGKEVIQCQYDELLSFHEGLAKVEEKGKWGVINKKGEIVIPIIYDYISYFHEELASVKLDDEWGVINKKGEVVIPIGLGPIDLFHEGLARVYDKTEDSAGFIDTDGNLVIPYIYDRTSGFKEGLARVEKNGKWGFINKSGEVVIPFEYDNAYDFQDGLAIVAKNGKLGLVNKLGEVIAPCKYNALCNFNGDLAQVKLNDKWGFINKSGEVVIPFEYDYISNFQEGFSQVLKDGKIYYIDKNNQKLNLKIIINEASDIFNIPNNSTIIDTKIGYALDFQEDKVLFNSNEEREEFIKLLDKTININPSYKSKKLTKKQKTNA